jgi:hypothetical protein
VLSTVVTRDDWPPQRAVAGFDLPFRTPVANLWNVGDGVKEYANGGTTACAETAKLVVGQITARFPLAAQPEGTSNCSAWRHHLLANMRSNECCEASGVGGA